MAPDNATYAVELSERPGSLDVFLPLMVGLASYQR
jgi:hypothetical protein